MAEPKYEDGRVERFRGDQLVVALPHLDLVRGELTRLRAHMETQSDALLGLALITIDNMRTVVGALSKDAKTTEALAQCGAEFPEQQGRKIANLDRLLRALRALFACRYAHWTPTMGKNRVVGSVKGFPHLGGGAVGDPVKANGRQFRVSVGGPEAGQGVRVAVLDTAVASRPELVGHFLGRSDAFFPPERPPGNGKPPSTLGHGTFATGLIVRRAPRAAVELHRILDRDATGEAWDAAKEMARLAGSGVDILNMSCGAMTDDNKEPLVLARAVELLTPDVVIVAAAGNHGDIRQHPGPGLEGIEPVTPIWPAAMNNVVAVAAADAAGQLAEFSPKAPWVTLVAPGVEVESTYLNGDVSLQPPAGAAANTRPPSRKFQGFALWSGTSFAAANVSGAIAARTRPGQKSAREALEDLKRGSSYPTTDVDDGVRPFTLDDLGS
jgi:membrane-anchored mycosin MYCP